MITNYMLMIIIFIEFCSWFRIWEHLKKCYESHESITIKKLLINETTFFLIFCIELAFFVIYAIKIEQKINIEIFLLFLTLQSRISKGNYIRKKSKKIIKKEINSIIKIIESKIIYDSIQYKEELSELKIISGDKIVKYYIKKELFKFDEYFFLDRKKMKEEILEEFTIKNKKEVIEKKWQQVIKLVMK